MIRHFDEVPCAAVGSYCVTWSHLKTGWKIVEINKKFYVLHKEYAIYGVV